MDDIDDIDEIVQEFLVESHENLDQLDRDLVALERTTQGTPQARDLLASIFRTIHTIKGTSGFLAFGRLESVTHVGENLLARLRDARMDVTPATTDVLLAMVDTVRALLAVIEERGDEGDIEVADVVERITEVLEGRAPAAGASALDPGIAAPRAVSSAALAPPAAPPAAPAPVALPEPEDHGDEAPHRRSVADSSIRVDVDLLDQLMRLVGELVLTRNQVVRRGVALDDAELTSAVQRLNLISSELQEGVVRTRMQPIEHLWSKLPRVVRDLGSQCGKSVRLEMVGKDTELDRSLLEAVKDPLTHLVRNCVDHGIESAADRLAAGKPAEGVVTLRARHQGGQVVVEVADDGAGMDPERIAAKAVEKGLRTPVQIAAMASGDLLQLIFAPGFSTAEAVTNVSGRGVGMDVVRTNIEAIGGTVEVESVLGQGATCRLRIPLTLAIVPALTVECAGDRYAIPQVNLLELLALDADRARTEVEEINGARVHRLRGQLLPLVRLTDLLDVERASGDGSLVVAVLQAEGRRFGLVIDRVLSTEEIVVKPLASRIKSVGPYSGATILGDGAVALILDVPALGRRVLVTEGGESEAATRSRDESVSTEDSVRLLVAGLGAGRRAGLPLTSVTRLEQMPASAFEWIGSREVLQYRGGVLPVARLGAGVGLPDTRHADTGFGAPCLIPVVVWTEGGHSAAVVVDEILDVVEDAPPLREQMADRGVLGSTLVEGRLLEVVDVRAAIRAVDPNFGHYALVTADSTAPREVR